MQIAIDGPCGAGKSTIAKLLAQRLNCLYLDTGAMYRTVALLAVRTGTDRRDDAALEKMLEGAEISVTRVEGRQHMLLNGEDVEALIRTPEISLAASDVSTCASVRARMVALQRKIAGENDVVMDGRDIGTRVLPQADYKFFLTASDTVRARRRYEELQAKGEKTTLDEVLSDVRRRDLQDTTRRESPLTLAPDATEVSTDDLGIDDVVTVLLALMGRF